MKCNKERKETICWTLELKGGLGTQILPIALNGDLRLGGRDGVDGAVCRDGGGSDGERVIRSSSFVPWWR